MTIHSNCFAHKNFCMNSYLIFRYIFDRKYCFNENFPCNIASLDFDRKPIKTTDELIEAISETMNKISAGKDIALALSGGIDSAILARFMPEGSKAYTFRCVVPDKKVVDESEQAAVWARMNNLDHEIINITWEDILSVINKLMKHKGAPIHSIEAQIYIAAKKAKDAGATKFIFGENADIIYGGMDGLLKKNWLYGEFIDRYMYVNPYHVLNNDPQIILEPFKEFESEGHIDGYNFINKYFRQEALGTYNNACETAGIEFVAPYSLTKLDVPIDCQRIRHGDTKYLIREAFAKLYPHTEIQAKIPMPRPMNEWLLKWSGPAREEFIPHCTDNMTGDQKWMVWCLERFLNMLDEEPCIKNV